MATTYPIDLVGGSKGGVGKIFVSLALADHLQRRDFPVALVETDTSNPDVMKAIQDEGHNFTRTYSDSIKNGLRFLPLIQDGSRPRPLHVAPVFGSRYFGGTGAFAAFPRGTR